MLTCRTVWFLCYRFLVLSLVRSHLPVASVLEKTWTKFFSASWQFARWCGVPAVSFKTSYESVPCVAGWLFPGWEVDCVHGNSVSVQYCGMCAFRMFLFLLVGDDARQAVLSFSQRWFKWLQYRYNWYVLGKETRTCFEVCIFMSLPFKNLLRMGQSIKQTSI